MVFWDGKYTALLVFVKLFNVKKWHLFQYININTISKTKM